MKAVVALLPGGLKLQLRLMTAALVLVAAIWGLALYEIRHDREEVLRQAETATMLKAQIYAENTRSTIKRLNELLIDLRSDWKPGGKGFAETIQARQAHISDLTFQIGIIDADGYLAFSNLAPATARTDLRDREHFRFHRTDDPGHDLLFISKPLLGRVSGKWSIQFTRPIWQGLDFKGVVVASISPETLSAFHEHLHLSPEGASSIARDSGEIMARNPHTQELVGKKVTWPFSSPSAPVSGNFHFVAQLDGIERIFGYHKLPEYGLTFFAAESLHQILAPHRAHSRSVMGYAGIASLSACLMLIILFRSMAGKEGVLRQLHESETRQKLLSSAIRQSNASVIITDAQANIVFVNEAFERTTGYAQSEVLGQNPRILKSGLNPPQMYRDLWSALPKGGSWQGELHNRKKNGDLYWESATISPVVDDAGRITHYIAVKEDITERKRQEVELRHAKEDAEAANIAKSQFLATMSHEIRTPMNGILGMAQLLLMPNLSESERNEYAHTILSSGNTLQALLNDILDLSKVEAGKLTLSPAMFDPVQMLEEIAALFGDLAARKGLKISSRWTGPQKRYFADPVRLRQMLTNLVSNAVKFTERGTVAIEARELSHQDNAAVLRFSVTDTGIGIPADKQALLFQPFSQVDGSNTRTHSGTGLGLSIVRSLAELMKGRIGLTSEPGKGATFWFEVQVQLLSPELLPTQADPYPPDTPRETGSRHGTLMLVEDNPTNQLVIRTTLVKHGYGVEIHENGRLAFDALLGGARPALILMDCQMPVMDGFETTRAIRQWEAEQKLPPLTIIALTAGAFEEDRQRCLAAGMDDFITKPVEIDRLIGIIGQHLTPRGN